MIIKLIFLCAIIALWIIGGQTKGRYRDVPIPILLALSLAIAFKVWWLFLALGATYQIIRLGYGAYDPENDDKPSFLARIMHDRQGWYVRALWGLIVASMGASPLVSRHFIGLWPYLGYILINIFVNYMVCRLRLWVYFTDFLVSLAIGSVIFLK